MPSADSAQAPRFYFALSRLLAKAGGGNAERTEQNWLEANVVGFAVFSIGYLTLASLLPKTWSWWVHTLALLGLTFVTWLFWALVVYLNSLLIQLLRGLGWLRQLPVSRMQSVLVGILSTAFAWHLVRSGNWLRVIGLVWMAAVCCNLSAAAVLALTDADRPATK